jgi:hypothetical protein
VVGEAGTDAGVDIVQRRGAVAGRVGERTQLDPVAGVEVGEEPGDIALERADLGALALGSVCCEVSGVHSLARVRGRGG